MSKRRREGQAFLHGDPEVDGRKINRKEIDRLPTLEFPSEEDKKDVLDWLSKRHHVRVISDITCTHNTRYYLAVCSCRIDGVKTEVVLARIDRKASEEVYYNLFDILLDRKRQPYGRWILWALRAKFKMKNELLADKVTNVLGDFRTVPTKRQSKSKTVDETAELLNDEISNDGDDPVFDGREFNDRKFRYDTKDVFKTLYAKHRVQLLPLEGKFLDVEKDVIYFRDANQKTYHGCSVNCTARVDGNESVVTLASATVRDKGKYELTDFFYNLNLKEYGPWILKALRDRAKEEDRTISGLVMELITSQPELKGLKVNYVDEWHAYVELENGQVESIMSSDLSEAAKLLLEATTPTDLKLKAAIEYLEDKYKKRFATGPYTMKRSEFLTAIGTGGFYGQWFDKDGRFRNNCMGYLGRPTFIRSPKTPLDTCVVDPKKPGTPQKAGKPALYLRPPSQEV